MTSVHFPPHTQAHLFGYILHHIPSCGLSLATFFALHHIPKLIRLATLFTLHSSLLSYMLNLLFSALKCCNFATFLMSISSLLLITH